MPVTPTSYHTLRLETRGMGCAWEVILNAGAAEEVMHASSALDVVRSLEMKMSVFRDDSDLMRINRGASGSPQRVDDDLLDVLRLAFDISRETGGAFDPTSRPLSLLWKRCRGEQRVPTEEEIAQTMRVTGFEKVRVDVGGRTIAFGLNVVPSESNSNESAELAPHPGPLPHGGWAGANHDLSVGEREVGISIDLNGIGKGYAIDRVAGVLAQRNVAEFLIHGGFSSLYAAGVHCDQPGWPVGLKNPLLERGDFATIFLKDRGLSTSGTNVQFFRHGGKRYGHILDPRTGWPAEGLLSVTVLAPTAAEADALSTALYVMGADASLAWCEAHPAIGAILVPAPMASKVLRPAVIGISREQVVFQGEDVSPDWHPPER